jgi:hypothetical protein
MIAAGWPRTSGAVVLRSVIRRCIRRFLLLVPIALFAGQGVAHSTSQCSNSTAPSSDPVYAAKQTQLVKGANEVQVWKTINVGGSKGVNAIRVAIETAPCPMWIGDEADEILGRPAFPFVKAPVELDLVVLSVSELGFGGPASGNDIEPEATVQASLRDIYVRAVSLGFELCPAEVGPALRLNYLDQPLDEFLQIAMKPVARYTGELVTFTLVGGDAGFLLGGANGNSDAILRGVVRFVFVRPR